MLTNLTINPIDYVENKETNITIGLETAPLAVIKKIDDKIIIETRRFSPRDRSELPVVVREVTLEQLNNEKAEITNYLEKLNTLIDDATEL